MPMLPRAIKEGHALCWFCCFYYLIKLFFTLFQYQEIVEPTFSILILVIGLHDVINMLHYLNFNRQFNVLSLNFSITQIIIQEFVSYYGPMNGLLIIDIIEKKSIYFNCITIKLLHYFISVYTLVTIIFISTDIPMFIQLYIVLLIIYWFIPVLLCFVLPFVMLWFIVLRQKLNYQQNRNIIINFYDQLQNIKFRILKEKHPSLQSNDCPICYQQINESRSVIQMPCHQEHYFHAECCRQWLGRDSCCSLCRVGLEQQPKDDAQDKLELHSKLLKYPLFYTLQDHKETRKKQVTQWGEIVHLYFQSHKILESSIRFILFDKSLDSSEIKEILNQMAQLGSIEWKNDQNFPVNLVSPFELAVAIYAWAKEKKLIVTQRHQEALLKEVGLIKLKNLPQEQILKACLILEETGRCQVYEFNGLYSIKFI
ncbi:unnamed protein product [Paramecium pentaurelia]|uniref:RING-type domain-containing protein n=1 Tax=Paramecium pentaurelia TaxID=43138 RepID=A0A8S1Y1W7_9CILI|nr:unnamed protein product [Paramecium pentaurelia]